MRKQSQAPGDPGKRRVSLRLHGTIARDLGIKIVSGFYQPGDILDGEVAASGLFEVSRTAYREGVRILAAKGLVESRPKTGTRVSSRDRWHLLDPDVLSWIFAHEPDDSLVVSLFELRKIVEPQAAALAAGRRTDAQLQVMAQGLADMARFSLATEEGRAADKVFHAALLEASANPFLVSLNLEHHHFKYDLFRRPGDIHVHFFGTATLSVTDGVVTQAGDRFEMVASPFRRPLRNPLAIADATPVTIGVL